MWFQDIKVAPCSCRTDLYRSVWNFVDRQMFWKERIMKSCVLRFFYGEITKCSVFRPRFRKLLRLALSAMFSYVESKFYHVSNDFMDFSLNYPLIPSVDFF